MSWTIRHSSFADRPLEQLRGRRARAQVRPADVEHADRPFAAASSIADRPSPPSRRLQAHVARAARVRRLLRLDEQVVARARHHRDVDVATPPSVRSSCAKRKCSSLVRCGEATAPMAAAPSRAHACAAAGARPRRARRPSRTASSWPLRRSNGWRSRSRLLTNSVVEPPVIAHPGVVHRVVAARHQAPDAVAVVVHRDVAAVRAARADARRSSSGTRRAACGGSPCSPARRPGRCRRC